MLYGAWLLIWFAGLVAAVAMRWDSREKGAGAP